MLPSETDAKPFLPGDEGSWCRKVGPLYTRERKNMRENICQITPVIITSFCWDIELEDTH